MYIYNIEGIRHKPQNKTVNFKMNNSIEPMIVNRIDKYGRPYRITLTKEFHPNSKIKSKVEILIDYIKHGVAKKITKTFSPEKVIQEKIEMGGGKTSSYKHVKKYDENGNLIYSRPTSYYSDSDFELV